MPFHVAFEDKVTITTTVMIPAVTRAAAARSTRLRRRRAAGARPAAARARESAVAAPGGTDGDAVARCAATGAGAGGCATAAGALLTPGLLVGAEAAYCWRVLVYCAGSQSVPRSAPPRPASSCALVGRAAGSLARQRSITGRTSCGRPSR